MSTQFERDMDACIDNALSAISEVQSMAAQLGAGKTIDAWGLYEQACRIEYALDVLRECRPSKDGEKE